MELVYANEKVEAQCTSAKAARKLFDGNEALVKSLIARMNALRAADCIKDITVQPAFHFHKLEHKQGRNLEGYFAIDVKSRKEPWRIIVEPLDENKNPFVPCRIDEIASKVRIVGITEVSNHYE